MLKSNFALNNQQLIQVRFRDRSNITTNPITRVTQVYFIIPKDFAGRNIMYFGLYRK